MQSSSSIKHPPPRDRVEVIILALLEEILSQLQTLRREVDALDRALKPYGDGTKVRRRR